MTRIDEIRERAEKATAGPWEYDGAGCVGVYGKNDVHMYDICECDDIWTENAEANGEFIAHSREDIPYLLGEIDKLREQLEAANKRADAAVKDMYFTLGDDAGMCSICKKKHGECEMYADGSCSFVWREEKEEKA